LTGAAYWSTESTGSTFASASLLGTIKYVGTGSALFEKKTAIGYESTIYETKIFGTGIR